MNPLFLVYCPTVRHLQGLSWPHPDCFVFVCLSLGPERQEWDSKKKKKQKGKKAIPFPGLIIEALGSDMSWLKQHHFCHSCLATDLTNDAVGSPPDAIKYGVKQEGLPSALLFQPLLVPTPWPRCFFLKSKVQWHFSIFFSISGGFGLSVYFRVVFVFSAYVLLPPVRVGLRHRAGASLTGVWVLIAQVSALISGPQLPASSCCMAKTGDKFHLAPDLKPSSLSAAASLDFSLLVLCVLLS